MINGVIQGTNAIFYIFKNDWVQFVCMESLSITVSPDTISTRTPGAGHWGKNTYQKINWNIYASGVLIVNQISDTNYTGLDFLDNIIGFTNALCRITYTDDQGNIKSVQGYGVVSGMTWSMTTGAVVKDDISILGDGELKFFDGLFPCVSSIISITPTGMTGGTGVITITYTYTGAPYQVKWRLNGVGAYSYALLGVSIVTPPLTAGSYSIEIIPVCANGYESDNSASQAFAVTLGGTCSATTSSISTSGGSLVPTFTGTPSQWKYSIDGAPYTTLSILVTGVNISGLAVGPHTASAVPICSNGVEGTGILNQAFTVSATPTTFTLNWQLASFVAGNSIQIFVNGVLALSTITPGTGTITGASGSTIIARVMGNNNSGSFVELKTQDTTTSTVLNDQTGHCPVTLSYTFAVTGDTYSVLATITP